MEIKYILFSLLNILIFSSPVYGTGFEEVNIFKTILQLMFYLGVFIAVIILSIYGTRFIARNYRKAVSSKYVELLDVINIAGGSKILILKINEQIYVLYTSNNNATVIDKFSKDDFPIKEDNFDNYLERYFDKFNINLKTSKLLNKLNLKKDLDKEDKNDEKKN